MKTATEILFEYSIDIMSMEDTFNSQLLHAMEEYKNQDRWISVEEDLPEPLEYISKKYRRCKVNSKKVCTRLGCFIF